MKQRSKINKINPGRTLQSVDGENWKIHYRLVEQSLQSKRIDNDSRN